MEVLFTVKSVNNLLNVIKEYIVYVYPGFITLMIYRFIIAKNVEENEYTLIKSIIISYIYVAILEGITKINFSKFIIPHHIILLIVACIVPIIWNCIFKSSIATKSLRAIKIDTSVHENMLESLRAKEEGLWIRVYMDDYGIMYEGTLRGHESDPNREQQIALSGYRFYRINSKSKEKECIIDYANKKQHWVKIREKDITRMEVVYENPQ